MSLYKTFAIRLSKEDELCLSLLAENEHRSRGDLVRQLLREKIDQEFQKTKSQEIKEDAQNGRQ